MTTTLGIAALGVFTTVFFLVALGTLVEVRQLAQNTSLHSPHVGTPVPDFRVSDLTSKSILTAKSLLKQPRVLVFLSPECASCDQVLHELMEGPRLPAFIAVCEGGRSKCEAFLGDLELTAPVLLDEGGRIARALGASRFPFAVAVSGGRIIGQTGIKTAQDVAKIMQKLSE